MTFRRTLSDLIDPGRLVEILDLRDSAVQAEQRRHNAIAALIAEKVDRAIETAAYRVQLADLRSENAALRADVARLLEQGARCAHGHEEHQ